MALSNQARRRRRLLPCPAELYPFESHAWLATDFGLSLFSTDLVRARLAYRQFVLEDPGDADLDHDAHPVDSRVLGTDRFIDSLPVVPYKPRSALTLEQLVESICTEHRIPLQHLRSPSRSRSLAKLRLVLATQALDHRGATLAEVARYLHRDPSAITKLIVRHVRKRSGPRDE